MGVVFWKRIKSFFEEFLPLKAAAMAVLSTTLIWYSFVACKSHCMRQACKVDSILF